MIEPRRRPGRPKGSRNRPKPKATILVPAFGQQVAHKGGPLDLPPMPPQALLDAPPEEPPPAPPVVYAPDPPRTIRIVLAMHTALSQPGRRLEIEWPAGMPLPVMGDRVVVEDQGGYVASVEYHPLERLVLFQLR